MVRRSRQSNRLGNKGMSADPQRRSTSVGMMCGSHARTQDASSVVAQQNHPNRLDNNHPYAAWPPPGPKPRYERDGAIPKPRGLAARVVRMKVSPYLVPRIHRFAVFGAAATGPAPLPSCRPSRQWANCSTHDAQLGFQLLASLHLAPQIGHCSSNHHAAPGHSAARRQAHGHPTQKGPGNAERGRHPAATLLGAQAFGGGGVNGQGPLRTQRRPSLRAYLAVAAPWRHQTEGRAPQAQWKARGHQTTLCAANARLAPGNGWEGLQGLDFHCVESVLRESEFPCPIAPSGVHARRRVEHPQSDQCSK